MGNKKYYDSPKIELKVIETGEIVRTSVSVHGDDNVGLWNEETWG